MESYAGRVRAARWAAVACCSLFAVSAIESGHVLAAPDSGDALLADVGPDWTLADETTFDPVNDAASASPGARHASAAATTAVFIASSSPMRCFYQRGGA